MSSNGGRVADLLGWVGGFMVVAAVVYAVINGILAQSVGLKGGVPEGDLEASLVVGSVGIVLLLSLAAYRKLRQGPKGRS